MTYAGRVEAKYTVPSSTTVSATNSGGGPTSVGMTAGSYFHTAAGAVSGGIATFQSVLNSTRAASVGSWAISLSTGATGDGRVTIDCTSGAKITKSGGVNGTSDGGASSVQTITADGFIEATVSDITAARWFGLSTTDPNVSNTTINYAIRFDSADYSVYENGVLKQTFTGLSVGDTLRVNRTGTTITFLRNGAVYYTSATPSAGALLFDVSLITTGVTLQACRLANVSGSTTTYSTITWQNVANATTTATTYSLAWTSTTWRDALGFTADISSANSPQTGTKQAKFVWRPECPLNSDQPIAMVPLVTDLRTTQGPTGVVLGLTGNSLYQHSARYSHVPVAYIREAAAAYANGSLEAFLKDSQFGSGHSYGGVSLPVQVYAHDGTLMGSDLNSGLGTSGWCITGLDRIKPTRSVDGWDGLWKVEFPTLVSSG